MICRQRRIFLPGFFDVLVDELDDAFDQGVRQPLFDRLVAPGQVLGAASAPPCFLTVSANSTSRSVASGRRLSSTSSTRSSKSLGNLFVHRELAGVDDAHVQAGPDRVIQERRVHRLAHHVVAAERERDVAHAAGDLRAGADAA